MTLEQLCEVGYTLASKILLNTSEELMTSFILVMEDGSWEVVHCPWADDDEKRASILTLGRHIIGQKPPVTMHCMLTEMWMSHYNPGEKMRAEMPLKDPQRREGVVAVASDGQEQCFRSWEIGRDDTGRCVSLTASEPGGEWQSWMTNALDNALVMQRLKRKIVEEYRTTGDVDTAGLPPKVQEFIKKYINEHRTTQGNQRGD